MSIEKALEYLDLAREQLFDTPAIKTAEELDRAISNASVGAVLQLSSSLVYTSPLAIRKAITLASASPLPSRMSLELPLPRFLNGVTFFSDSAYLRGVEVRHALAAQEIVSMYGKDNCLDRCRILGHVTNGARRGVGANHNGGCRIVGNYIDDCFRPPTAGWNDSQAICSWDAAPGLIIENNFLSASSETVMLGGADSQSAGRIPSTVVIRDNFLTAKKEWQVLGYGVKTRFELKCCRDVRVERNVIENVWIQGQAGYLVSFTVRNQDGTAPWSTIEDVVFDGNTCRGGVAALNILAMDGIHPSQSMARVKITRNRFEIDSPLSQRESHKLILIGQATMDLAIDANEFTGQYVGSQVYFDGEPKHKNLILTNNHWPKSLYGIFGSNSPFGKAWDVHVESGVNAGNVET